MGRSKAFAFGVGLAALVTLSAVPATAADDGAFAWQIVGAETYATFCATCHQPNGQGISGAFPPLAGHAPTILVRPGGSDYLAHLVLYGLEGSITANGKRFSGAMPAWGGTLNDDQLAGALDYVLHSWDNEKALPAEFRPFLPADIAAARDTALTAAQVYARRPQEAPAAAATASVAPTFTQEQADRGQAIFRRNCQDCHGANLNDGEFGGTPLNGQTFARHWGSGSVAALYGYMRAKMPPDRPGKLDPQTYADLTAFLLAKNGYQTAEIELPADPEAEGRMNVRH